METYTSRAAQLSIAYVQGQKGFVVLFTIIFLPLCMTGLSIFHKLGDILQHLQKMNSFCRLAELKYQNILSYELTALMRLNRPAKKLQKQYTRARKAMLKALQSGDLATAAALKLRLVQIKKQQMLLRLKQQKIFQRVQRLNIRKQQESRTRLQSHIRHNVELQFSRLKLAVQAKPPGAIAPVYELQDFFRRQQKSDIQWHIAPLSIQGECGASLMKESNRWKAMLFN